MEGIGPADVSIFHEENVGVVAVVFFLEDAVVEAGVDHEEYVVEVEGVGDCVFVEQYLFLVLAELFADFIEVDDAVVDGLFVSVVLTDPQSL